MTLSRPIVLSLVAAMLAMPVRADNLSGDPVYKNDTPKGFAMVGDLLVARPLLVGATLVGTALFIVSLPFSLASGSVGSTAESLVLEPGREAFVRCLGCSRPGYSYSVQEQD